MTASTSTRRGASRRSCRRPSGAGGSFAEEEVQAAGQLPVAPDAHPSLLVEAQDGGRFAEHLLEILHVSLQRAARRHGVLVLADLEDLGGNAIEVHAPDAAPLAGQHEEDAPAELACPLR